MSWLDTGDPPCQQLLLSIDTLAQTSSNCPYWVKDSIHQNVERLRQEPDAKKQGVPYAQLKNPTVHEELLTLHEMATEAAGLPKPQGRPIWFTIRQELENFPSGT